MKKDPILQRFFAGDRLALSKIISRVENNSSSYDPILDQVLKKVRGAYRIGVTGPPGAGKSTLVDGLVRLFRRQGNKIGVIAVDPTSPFTGGALLGDRIRMQSIQDDPEVFIRSMATRGSLGGLAHRTLEVADVMDAFGKDIIFLETVGVGQSELDVVEAADTVLVVLVPESGDSVQAMKAGLMEIGDIFVLNKSDHENAARAFVEISSVLELREETEGWKPRLVQTVADRGKGLEELAQLILEHRHYMEASGKLQAKRKRRVRERLRNRVKMRLLEQFWTPEKEQLFEKLADEVFAGQLTYQQAIERLEEGSSF
jgi:LAO/AO transport system kinase